MKIGVKYCGGCNPRYDRIGEVNKLKGELSGLEFVAAADHPDCDAVLVVCGCVSACADTRNIRCKGRMLVALSQEDMERARHELMSLQENAKEEKMT